MGKSRPNTEETQTHVLSPLCLSADVLVFGCLQLYCLRHSHQSSTFKPKKRKLTGHHCTLPSISDQTNKVSYWLVNTRSQTSKKVCQTYLSLN